MFCVVALSLPILMFLFPVHFSLGGVFVDCDRADCAGKSTGTLLTIQSSNVRKLQQQKIYILNSNTINNNSDAIYKEYLYLVNVQGYKVVEVICKCS